MESVHVVTRTNREIKSVKFARRMYTSVAIPRILYAVDIWAPPTYNCKQKEKPTANKRFTM